MSQSTDIQPGTAHKTNVTRRAKKSDGKKMTKTMPEIRGIALAFTPGEAIDVTSLDEPDPG
jgi:hypothetical protein